MSVGPELNGAEEAKANDGVKVEDIAVRELKVEGLVEVEDIAKGVQVDEDIEGPL